MNDGVALTLVIGGAVCIVMGAFQIHSGLGAIALGVVAITFVVRGS